MKKKYESYFMDIAKRTAQLSYAKNLQVGCVIVRDSNILSVGYNGTLPGMDNACEDYNGVTKPDVIHAEENALMALLRRGESSMYATIFVTHAPCVNCARLLVNAGIRIIYYQTPYRLTAGTEYLLNNWCSVFEYHDDECIKL